MSLPPGPKLPASAQTARFVRRPADTLLGWHEKYGEIFTTRYLQFGTGVYVSNPEEIRAMFTGDQSNMLAGEANAPLAAMLGDNSLLVLDGERHMRQRKLLLPPFNGSMVSESRELIREVAQAEVASWRVGDDFSLRERMRDVTFEVICRVVFGVRDKQRVEDLREALLALLDTGGLFMLPRVARTNLGPISPGGLLARRMTRADELIYDEIRMRRKMSLSQRNDVLSLLLQAEDGDGNGLTDQELRDQLLTMLAAGHETTATGLAFTFDLLLRHPEVLGRLLDEIRADAGNLYLEAVISESLRLRPVIDAAERTLLEPRTICGFELPAGIRVYPASLLVQRRSDLYTSPDEFRPERFLEEGAESYSWIPFGGGIRRCIGASLAQAEMAEVIRVILQGVQIAPIRALEDPIVLRGITMAPKYGVEVRVDRVMRQLRSRLALPVPSAVR